MKQEQLIYLNAFNCIPSIGQSTLHKLARHFNGDFATAWKSPADEFKRAGIAGVELNALRSRSRIRPDNEFEKVIKEGISIMTLSERAYPPLLKEVYAPPMLLYANGNTDISATAVAVVGTRVPSDYGKRAVLDIATQLARCNICVVSGLARGIDGIAHRAAIDNGAPTVAVVGSGIDKKSIYPREHARLAERIAANDGAVISEFPPGTKPTKDKFPRRNRIISGMSRATIVIEAAEKSGALITARHALEQNRDVFAVPGQMYAKLSKGTNTLIRSGASCITSTQDILNELDIKCVYNEKTVGAANEVEKAIMRLLKNEPCAIDALIRNSGIEARTVNAALIEMELNGKVTHLGNDVYALSV